MDQNGDKLALHLCCSRCRAVVAKEARARLIELATAPANCSHEIPVAPARGPMAEFHELRALPKGDGFEVVKAPYRAGCPARARDVFDTMTDQARRRGGVAPFTAAEIGAGRDYRDLFERVQSAGVKCSKAFDLSAGGHGASDFMDAFRRDSRRLEAFTQAIGDGVAKDIRRKVSAISGGVKVGDVELRQIGRKLITARTLVDNVCIADCPLSAVLEAHGWRATGKNISSLRAALRAALGRMTGI